MPKQKRKGKEIVLHILRDRTEEVEMMLEYYLHWIITPGRHDHRHTGNNDYYRFDQFVTKIYHIVKLFQ